MTARFALTLLTVALLPACSSTAAAPSQSPPTTTSAAAATSDVSTSAPASPASASATPAATRTPAPQADVKLARAATLRTKDLGPKWTEDTPAQDNPLGPGSCGIEPGGPYDKVGAGAARNGATAHLGKTRWYVSSAATVFPSESAARDWITIRKSPAFVECRRKQLEAPEKARNAALTVKTEATTAKEVGSDGLEVHTTYRLRFTEDSKVRDTNGVYYYDVYRFGRTVLTLQSMLVSGAKDPTGAQNTFDKDSGRALVKAYNRIMKAS